MLQCPTDSLNVSVGRVWDSNAAEPNRCELSGSLFGLVFNHPSPCFSSLSEPRGFVPPVCAVGSCMQGIRPARVSKQVGTVLAPGRGILPAWLRVLTGAAALSNQWFLQAYGCQLA